MTPIDSCSVVKWYASKPSLRNYGSSGQDKDSQIDQMQITHDLGLHNSNPSDQNLEGIFQEESTIKK